MLWSGKVLPTSSEEDCILLFKIIGISVYMIDAVYSQIYYI